MSKRKNLTPDEQEVLDQVQVRLLCKPDDVARCDELIVEHHYLHDATLVGEHLRYAILYKGKWLAVATWSGAALHLKARDQFIGWTAEQCRCRRSLIANNARLLVLPDSRYPNLISRFMKLMLGRLSADWLECWKHPVVLAETFVDPPALSRHRLQGQRLEPPGAHRRLEARRSRFLRKARCAQTDLDPGAG